MKRAIITLLLFVVALFSLAMGYGENKGNNKKAGNSLSKTSTRNDYIIYDANNIRTYLRNNGSFNRDPGTGDSGFEWPKGSGLTAIYASGLWVGAQSGGVTRVAVAEYSYEYDAGPIGAGIDPTNSRYRMYKIKRGDNASNSDDYANWPFDDGAPALRNFNNTADSLDGDGNKIPQLLGDMTIWTVYNDNNPSRHTNMNAEPLGVEIQQTAWGFNRADALGNAMFIRWRVINKGGRHLDSVYVSIWSDCDIGGGTADFDGCDTTLGLGYTFSGSAVNPQYGSQPPAAGFDFLQGPLVPATGETAILPGGIIKPGYKILKMTSYLKYNNDATDLGNPSTGEECYNYFKGLTRTGQVINGEDGLPTTFMFSGDPTLPNGPTNWIETGQSGDRRFMMSAGPFTMAVNDTQDIVAGVLIAQGSDNIAAVTALKNADALVQKAYELDFILPAPPPAPLVEASNLDNAVVLTWGKDESSADAIESYEAIDRIAGAGGAADSIYNFEGYVVYQFSNASKGSPRIVATYDVDNGVGIVYDNVFDASIGNYVNKPVVFGADNGIFRSIRITRDLFTGLPLVNNKDYYFGVSAYAYNRDSDPHVLESSSDIIVVHPQQTAMGNTYSSSGLDTIGVWDAVQRKTVAPHTVGTSQGYVVPIVTQPEFITGDTYEVRFDAGTPTTWRLVNVTKNIVLDSNRTNMVSNDSHPIKDGMMVKVIDAPYSLSGLTGDIDWLTGDPTYGLTYFGGGLELGIHAADLIYYGWAPTLPFGSYKKVQVVVDSNNMGWSYRYRRFANAEGPGGYRMVFQNMVQIPVRAWDVTDAAAPRQLNIAWRDQTNLGSYDIENPYDLISICGSTYDTTGAAYTGVVGGPFESDCMYIYSFGVAAGSTPYERANTITMTPYRVHTPTDVFTINTSNYKPTKDNVATAKTQIERINAVPNPYFVANAYEHNQFNKVMRITNLPMTAKIRIFNLVGELVRVLDKNNPATTDIDWDLTNNNHLPVASGMYIIHIDLGDIGSKVIKVAVIQAEERLDNF